MRVLRVPLLITALALAPQGVSSASATPPPPDTPTFTLTAEPLCQADVLRVSFTVTASDGNPTVIVSLNGAPIVPSYALSAANGNVITDVKDAPGQGGDPVVVSVLFSGTWANGAPGGQSASTSVTLPEDCGSTTPGTGRFTGGGNTVTADGVKLTRGFTIHCDLILSNNLEINWPGTGRQNQFHMLEHTAATCTDDPAIDQRPPNAPVDTIVGVGTGRFNGTPGYTVNFTLVDAGEPGTADQIGLVITAPGGAVVLNLPLQNITGGNVQAHFDQPHKK